MTRPVAPFMASEGKHSESVRLAVIVPMFNEIAGAENCVRRILNALPALPIASTLIVINDGSFDGTGTKLDELNSTIGNFHVVHKPNGGYGSAIIRGAQEALKLEYDYVLFMDSDLTNPPEQIVRFIGPMVNGADLIKATRFSLGGNMDAVPWSRRIYSVMGISPPARYFASELTTAPMASARSERGYFSICRSENADLPSLLKSFTGLNGTARQSPRCPRRFQPAPAISGRRHSDILCKSSAAI